MGKRFEVTYPIGVEKCLNLFVRQTRNSQDSINPPVDRTDGIAGMGDQTAAIVGSFHRGRIDKPFGWIRKLYAQNWRTC